jgi:hypothetical protein
MLYQIKDEIIAQFSDQNNQNHNTNLQTSLNLANYYVVGYLCDKYNIELLNRLEYFIDDVWKSKRDLSESDLSVLGTNSNISFRRSLYEKDLN